MHYITSMFMHQGHALGIPMLIDTVDPIGQHIVHVLDICNLHAFDLLWAYYQYKYHEGKLMSYIYIGIKEQRVRDLMDQLPDDHHKLDKNVEVDEKSYVMFTCSSIHNIRYQFRCKFKDTVKHSKEKINHAHIVDSVINLANALLKRRV